MNEDHNVATFKTGLSLAVMTWNLLAIFDDVFKTYRSVFH
jgi:hypothetical protein